MLEQPAKDESQVRFAQNFAALVRQRASHTSLVDEPQHVSVPPHWLRAAFGRSAWRMLTPGRLSFALVVLLPTYCTSFYSLILASNRYVAEFRVCVRSIERQKMGGLSDLLGFGGISPTGNDSYAVVQYLQSRRAIADLGGPKTVGRMFNGAYVDWFSRLGADVTIEEFTRYWNRMVEAVYENSTGAIIVRVATFAPEDSENVAKSLLANAESLVNKMSDRAHHDSVDFASNEVTQAQTRLDGVREKIRALQDREAMLDPSKSAETTLAIAAKLKEQIAKLSAELVTQRSRLAEDAPSVVGTRNTIMGLQRELASVDAETTGARAAGRGQTERPLSSVLGSFQQLADDKAFAEKAYLNALSALETAKMDAAKQQIYLATIVPPELPEEPAFPRPLRQIFITFCVSGALWLIGWLGVRTVREHA